MIPILYEKTETAFQSNGLGRLADCLRCIVTEERNGIYECEFDYPITGTKYPDIQEGRIIAVTHDDNKDIQPFDIYHRTAPIDGVVTFYARHISYRQNGITVKPFTASGIANALAGLKTNSIGSNPFTYWTDRTTAGTYTVKKPGSLKSLLGGEQNSILDVFGSGEYEFDRFSVKLWNRRGSDTSVEIRYGKNLVDVEHDIDFSESYNGIVPFWHGTVINEIDEETEEEEEVLVTLPEWAVYAEGTTYDGRNKVIPLDLSDKYDDPPTEAELRRAAEEKLSLSDTLSAIENIRVSFVQLWQTEEYKDIAPLQAVGLCDTVNVVFPELGLDRTKVKVIRTVYNVLLDRYDQMELGDSMSSYASIITAGNTSAIASLEDGLLMVSGAANKAVMDADAAHKAAVSAKGDAHDANVAARAAQASADEAAGLASNAQSSANAAASAASAAHSEANAAAASAIRANTSADSALNQLSVIQDVLDTLNWIAEHGTYELSADTQVEPGKYYFDRQGDEYNIVIDPEGDPSESGYYELSGIDEALTNYVTSHLALTGQGLWLTKDDDAYKILIASDGMRLYDDEGNLVASFGESINFASDRPQYIGNNDAYIVFYDSDNDSIPDAINIGGSKVTIMGNKRLSDLLTTLDISTRQTAGGAEITVAGQTVSLSDGEDAAVLRIDSSRGTVFKNNQVSTVLTVAVYRGSLRITNITDLRSEFGNTAHLQWKWQRMDDSDFGIIVTSDRKLSNDGFTLTLTPEDVDTKVTFMCELLT